MMYPLLLGLTLTLAGSTDSRTEAALLDFAVSQMVDVGQLALRENETSAPSDARFSVRIEIRRLGGYVGGIPDLSLLSRMHAERCVDGISELDGKGGRKVTTVDVACSKGLPAGPYAVWGAIVVGRENAWIHFEGVQARGRAPPRSGNVVFPGVWLAVRWVEPSPVVLGGCVPRELRRPRPSQAGWDSIRSHCAEFPLESQVGPAK